MKPSRVVLTLVAAAVGVAAPATAAMAATPTLFVDRGNPSCSNTGPGSQMAPFCSISAGAAKAGPGQTVQVATGTYTEMVTAPHSGTSTAPIVFTAAPGATVTVTGGTDGFKVSGRSWITIRNFTVTKTSSYGILATSSTHLSIVGNDVSYAGRGVSGATARGITLSATTNSLVQNNVTHNNTDAGIGLTSLSTGNTITGNDSSHNARVYVRAAAGIDLRNSGNNTISANRLHDNEDSGLNIWTSSNNSLAINNVVYNNGDHGIDVHNTNDARVVANTVYKNYDSGVEATGSLRMTLANNISVDNGINSARTSGQVRADAASAPSAVIDYDLVSISGPGPLFDWNGKKYSTITSFRSATGQETNGTQAAPQFVSAVTYDLHLTQGSPGIDSANSAASGQPATDAEGLSRVDDPNVVNTGAGTPNYVDRGAYEFQG